MLLWQTMWQISEKQKLGSFDMSISSTHRMICIINDDKFVFQVPTWHKSFTERDIYVQSGSRDLRWTVFSMLQTPRAKKLFASQRRCLQLIHHWRTIEQVSENCCMETSKRNQRPNVHWYLKPCSPGSLSGFRVLWHSAPHLDHCFSMFVCWSRGYKSKRNVGLM